MLNVHCTVYSVSHPYLAFRISHLVSYYPVSRTRYLATYCISHPVTFTLSGQSWQKRCRSISIKSVLINLAEDHENAFKAVFFPKKLAEKASDCQAPTPPFEKLDNTFKDQ